MQFVEHMQIRVKMDMYTYTFEKLHKRHILSNSSFMTLTFSRQHCTTIYPQAIQTIRCAT